MIGIPLTSEQSAAANTIMVKESVLLWKAQTQWSISSGFFVDPASIVLCSPGGAWAAFPNLQSNATNYEIRKCILFIKIKLACADGNQGIVSNFIAFRGQQSTLCCYQRVSKQGYFSAIKWKAFRDLSNVPVIDSVAYGDQEITAKSFPTASTVIEDFKMAIGYSDGSIRITHLSYIYNDTPEGCIRELTGGHCCSITALFCPRFAGSDCGSTDSTADKQPDIYPWLLSGADDGTIVLWNYK